MSKQALEGLKVADFCWVLAGPIVGLYLAHHGATVIRIESMRRPDTLRLSVPFKDNIPGVNRAGSWDYVNSNKLSMSLNLDHPKGIEVAKRLVAWSDVAGESFAPGIMERFGLGYNELKKVKPDILVKGQDWAQKGIVGTEFVESYGGKVVLAPLIEGKSSTSVIEKMKSLWKKL